MNRKTRSEPRVSYTPRPDVTPESEAKVLATVYQFVLECAKKDRAAAETAPDTKEGSTHDFRADAVSIQD